MHFDWYRHMINAYEWYKKISYTYDKKYVWIHEGEEVYAPWPSLALQVLGCVGWNTLREKVQLDTPHTPIFFPFVVMPPHTPIKHFLLMLIIAFSTFNSSLVPLIEDLWRSNPWEFEFSGFRCNRTDDLEINSLSLWPTDPRLHVRSK